jgi:pyruvate kinase
MKTRVKVDASNRTKIVATLGPACNAEGTLRDMFRAGMDVARINFSHGSADSNLELLAKVRKVAKDEGCEIAIMQDLQGAKLRVGQLPENGIQLLEGSMVTLRAGLDSSDGNEIPVPYEYLAQDIQRGDTILLNDGVLELEVAAIEKNKVLAKVIVGGTLISYKGWTVPGRSLKVEAFSEKDGEDLALGLSNNVDMVAMSFVRTVDDVLMLREKIEKLSAPDASRPQIIVKIEKHEAVANFDDILEATDGVLVARGDLGLETSIKSVPVTQKEIVAKCLVAAKPVIVATHMLSSMTMRPRPTRAEASDVANAVIDHTDAVMLSEETAMGKYPVRSVTTMSEIIATTEESPLDNLKPEKQSQGVPTSMAVAAGAVELASQLKAEAIIITTRSGYSARAVSRFRSEIPIISVTHDRVVCRQLHLSWGVHSIFFEERNEPEDLIKKAIKEMWREYGLQITGQIVMVSGLKKSKEDGYDPVVRVMSV